MLVSAGLLQVHQEATVRVPILNRALPELCYWRVTLGMDCPGCGLTRCFISAAHGHWGQAWKFNPVGVLLFAVLVCQIPYRPWQLWRIWSGRGELRTIEVPYVLLIASVLLIVQWFWRLLL